MSGSRIRIQQLFQQNSKNISSADRNIDCAIFCEENSSFLLIAALFTQYLWISREAAAAVRVCREITCTVWQYILRHTVSAKVLRNPSTCGFYFLV